jgi:hypothetical protein
MVNEARISWSRSRSDAVHQAFGVNPPAEATIPNSVTDPTVAGGLPGITIDGYFGGSGLGRIGSPDFLPKFQHTDQLEYLDSLSWLRGNHALKFGIDLIAPMKNEYLDVPATRGAMVTSPTCSSRMSGSWTSATGRPWASCRTTGSLVRP